MGRLRGRDEREGGSRGTPVMEAVRGNWAGQSYSCMLGDLLEGSDGEGERKPKDWSKLLCSAFLPSPSPTWENQVRINQSSRLLRDGG